MQFSFIIPTLNEEKHIGQVVRQFEKLKGIYSYEVIVGDSKSTDKTVSIARKFGASVRIDKARNKSAAGARNSAARAAKGDILVFCDADTLLEDVKVFAQQVLEAFADKRVVGAIPRLEVFPKERIWKDVLYHSLFNTFLRLSFFIRFPFSIGQCQVVRARAFRKAGMYPKDQVYGEDSALFKKLIKLGKLRIIPKSAVFESPRRYRKMGYLRMISVVVRDNISQWLFRKKIITQWSRVG